MGWAWNRWKILAAMLILATLIGLPFRPWGGGLDGQQVIEDRGMTLTCPTSLTAPHGKTTRVQCELSDESEPREGFLIESLGMEQVDSGRYIVTRNFVAGTQKSYEVEAERAPNKESEPWLGNNGANVEIRSLYARTIARIDVSTQYNPIFYTGLGLTWLLTMVLVGGPLAAIVAFALRRLRPGNGPLATVNTVLNEKQASDWLVWPWAYAASLRAISGAPLAKLDRALKAVDVLWGAYFFLAIITVAFRIIELTVEPTDDWLFTSSKLWVDVVFLGIIVVCGMWLTRQFTFFKVVGSSWEQIRVDDFMQEHPPGWVNSVPYIAVALIGWIGLYWMASYYWDIWLSGF